MKLLKALVDLPLFCITPLRCLKADSEDLRQRTMSSSSAVLCCKLHSIVQLSHDLFCLILFLHGVSREATDVRSFTSADSCSLFLDILRLYARSCIYLHWPSPSTPNQCGQTPVSKLDHHLYDPACSNMVVGGRCVSDTNKGTPI